MYRLFILVLLWQLCETRTAEEWKTRIIYQILTDRFAKDNESPAGPCTDLRSYCGGTFNGIRQNLDYIQGLGANAIWISPIPENTHLGYHGYWAKNLYKVNDMFGTEDELKQLVEECHRRDIWVMADVVANHMGYNDGCFWSINCSNETLLNFTGFTPFDRPDHYHTLCEIMDFRNQREVELCRLAKLPDLNQTNSYVRQTLLSWIGDVQKKYNFDGFRIDTVVEVAKDFWYDFQDAAGAYCVGEANNGDNTSYTAAYQGPLDAVLNFPLYFAVRKVFNEQKSMQILKNSLQEQRSQFQDVTILGNFLDNHDFPRFLSLTNDTALLKNALAYILLGEGIPIIYYGTEQKFNGPYDPDNRESLWPHYDIDEDMYKFIEKLSTLRQKRNIDFKGRNQQELFWNDQYMAFTRGVNHEVIAIVTNTNHSFHQTLVIPTGNNYSDGTEFQNIYSNEKVRIKENTLSLEVKGYGPHIYNMISISGAGSVEMQKGVECILGLLLAAILNIYLF